MSRKNTVFLYAPGALSKAQILEVKKRLSRVLGKKDFLIKTVVDESLIGGLLVKYGSKTLDLSVSGYVDSMVERLRNG